jgi:hypothetical protein
MSEKQPTSYVVCRYKLTFDEAGNVMHAGDNIPVKVFDTRREARAYQNRMAKRSKFYDYNVWPVKQG